MITLLLDHNSESSFHDLCYLYEAASPEQRGVLRREVDLADGTWRTPQDTTLADAPPRDALALRRVRDALIWHAIDAGEIDFRDNLVSIILVYHAALRLGADVETLFHEVAGIAPPS